MYDKVSELYNDLLETYFDKYYDLPNAIERSKKDTKYYPATLTLDEYDNNESY